MDEVYGWLGERYDFDTEAMRASSRFWGAVGFAALVVGVGALGRLLPFFLAQPGSFLAQIAGNIPHWLPQAGFWGGYTGLLAVFYGWLLGRSAKRLGNAW